MFFYTERKNMLNRRLKGFGGNECDIQKKSLASILVHAQKTGKIYDFL